MPSTTTNHATSSIGAPAQPLTQARVEGLEHDDYFVRSVMLRVLAGDPQPGPEAARRAIRQIEKYGWADAFEFSHQIVDLPHSEETVEWAAQWLEQSAPKRDDEVLRQQYQVARWYCKAPLDLMGPHIDRFIKTYMAAPPPKRGSIVSNPASFKNPGISFSRAGDRLATSCISTEECLSRFEETVAACLQTENRPHQEIAQLEILCESLMARKALSDVTIREWLDLDTDPQRRVGPEDFRAGAALLAIFYGDDPPPVDAVLRLFDLDWDWMNASIAAALVASGNITTLQKLMERYAGLDWTARLYVTGVFENLRFKECEAALCETLQNEDADDLRVNLAHALTLYGTPDSTSIAREIAKELPNDPERNDVLDLLCAHEILLGIESEETRRHRRQKTVRRHTEAHAAPAPSPSLFSAKGLGLVPASLATPRSKTKAKIVPFRPATPPPHPGVGRNDPCPCGSGKKFKKCCGP